jgi:hypothetical protein
VGVDTVKVLISGITNTLTWPLPIKIVWQYPV